MLEKVNTGRLTGASDRFDFDELVQEDRVHRLIYTDPAIFQAEMTNIFGAVWVYLGHESQIAKNDDYITVRLGLRPIILLRDSQRQDPRAVQPLHPSRHHAVPQGQGLGAHLHLPLSRLELPQHRQAARGAVARRLRLRLQGREVQRRAGAARRQLSRLHLRDAQSRCAAALDYLGAITKPIDEWLDRQPKGKIRVCEANRLKYKGNWKLAYDNSGDGYHVVFSHRSLLEMENRRPTSPTRACPITRARPTPRRCTWPIWATGITSRTSGRTSRSAPAACGRSKGPRPAPSITRRSCAAATAPRPRRFLDLASSEPVNINVFPNFSLLGNHIQVFEPVSVDETNVTWYGTAVVDEDGVLGGAVDEINALRMRTQEQFPNFGEVDDLANFEEIQRGPRLPGGRVGLHAPRLGIPGRVKTDANGIITAPATDEAFMREYIKEWKRLMKAGRTLRSRASVMRE
jgi:phenylpropionate dioxygenase-like ring-hydroxylating dioxygenase large terminal subunit